VIFDILEDKLIRAGFTAGENLFRSYMPAEAAIGVMIRTPLTGVPIDQCIPGWYRARMQVVTRHIDPVEGMNMANGVARVLRMQGLEIYPASAERGRAHLTLFEPDSLPVQFPQLDSNGYELSQQFNAAFGFEELVTTLTF
jgi:hypothetical protein